MIVTPAWIRVVASRWWYVWIPIHALVVWLQWVRIHYAIDVVILFVGTALFLSPSILYPTSQFAHGWRIVAISWATLMLRQAYFIFKPESRPAWLDLALIIIYVPGIVLVAKSFYNLPFQRRSRLSLFLDCLTSGFALTVMAWLVLGVAIGDVIFITGNMVVLFAMFNIYQQAKQELRDAFKATVIGLLSLILSDIFWLYLKTYGYPLIYIGPVYTWAWLNFGRAALVAPKTHLEYDEQSTISIHPIQDGLGTFTVSMCALLIVLFSDNKIAPAILIVLMVTMRVVEVDEYGRLQQRLDKARFEEGRLRNFLQSLGHDLKTPVNSIGLRIRDLAPKISPEEFSDLREQHATLRLRVTTLLNVARIMQQPLRIEILHLESIEDDIQQLWKTVSHIYGGQNLEFHFNAEEGVSFFGDKDALLRAIENILVNAIKATGHKSGIIQCSVATQGSRIVFDINDSGPGFSDDPLTGLPSTPIEGDGTGLGLIGVFSLVKELGGNVELMNPTTGGARVRISLLRYEKEPHESSAHG